MWDIIFPEKPRPFSPYLDAVLTTDLWNFREYWHNHAQDSLDEVLRLLDSNRVSDSEIPEEERHQNERRILIMGMDMMAEIFDFTTAPRQPEGQSPFHEILKPLEEVGMMSADALFGAADMPDVEEPYGNLELDFDFPDGIFDGPG
ncbi:hypothetical protein QBC34DRAFT_386401 [Podospora aff. communis PSN243]|uniref:Uncharacterized protein n=1 Tax=Podospora aff. communis PSN243 TaxID=3040156 RepID=A0AAV9G678_9PEZI|nr:hypothetical protein QBC34DRAFT_386401 [Podospora aff. communis PSN243]